MKGIFSAQPRRLAFLVSRLTKRSERAFELRKIGDFRGALREFKTLERLSWHPQDVAALRLLQATCLTDMGRLEEADKRLSTVDRNELILSKQVDYEYERARIARALGHIDSALEITEKALRTISTAVDKDEVSVVSEGLHTMRGILLVESGRCEEAIPILEAVPTDDLGWAEARLLLGDCSYRKRRYREAIVYYLSVISSHDKVSNVIRNDALRNTGSAFHQLKDYEKAVEYLSRVKNAYDEYPAMKAELFAFLASAYTHLGMLQEAAKYSGFSKATDSIQ